MPPVKSDAHIIGVAYDRIPNSNAIGRAPVLKQR
jgi:hypothetical protein